ncbi:MAG TPA: metallopeptidase family protein [Candidatus Limnocylindrales bacterium]|jgi:predicted Zn-dependent protease with MMP-like domain
MVKRRRGSRLASRARRSLRPSDRFEALVQRALEGIPPPFDRALEDVAIVIEDWPSRDQLSLGERGRDIDAYDLYGLYEGTPRTDWGADLVPFPNKITLFRVPLLEDFTSDADLEDEVRRTVLHELAHHLGIDDDRLTELGID